MDDVSCLIKEIKSYLVNFNEEKFKKAYKFAKEAHEGQFRKSLKPYIYHPVETVKNLISIRADEDSIIAGILHDVPEDTDKTLADIEKLFGKKVAFLVEGVTKFSLVHYQYNATKRQFDSIKNMLLHSAKDFRVMIIKLADRLHNMKTLQYLKEEKRIKISKETLEIYVPIADLLGLEIWKKEIEDLCFKNLLPDQYEFVSTIYKDNEKKYEDLSKKVKTLLSKSLNKQSIKAKIDFRPKNYYQAFKETSFDITNGSKTLHDDLNIYVIVEDNNLCYTVLGVIHNIFKPRLGYFKDYIALPKKNGYKSLHTSVFTDQGRPVNFIIRTPIMDIDASYGIAATNFYKEKLDFEDNPKNPKLEWLKDVLEVERDHSDIEDFFEDLKVDIFQDRIFVYTPKGDVVDLPNNATAIDFAYLIHTNLGHRASMAELNGRLVPLSTNLSTGDVIKIIPSDKGENPQRDWISFAQTNKAKHRIRDWFKKESQEEKMHIGKTILLEEFERAGIKHIDHISDKKIREFLAANEITSLNDLYVAVTEGSIEPLKIVTFLISQPKKFRNKKKNTEMIKIELIITAEDAIGRYHKILSVISDLGINMISTKANIKAEKKEFDSKLLLEIPNLMVLRKLFLRLKELNWIKKVKRVFWTKRLLFYSMSALTFFVWLIHPFFINYLSKLGANNNLLYSSSIILGLSLLLLIMSLLKKVFTQNLYKISELMLFGGIIFVLNIIAIATIAFEFLYLDLNIGWLTTFLVFLFLIFHLVWDIIKTKETFTNSLIQKKRKAN